MMETFVGSCPPDDELGRVWQPASTDTATAVTAAAAAAFLQVRGIRNVRNMTVLLRRRWGSQMPAVVVAWDGGRQRSSRFSAPPRITSASRASTVDRIIPA